MMAMVDILRELFSEKLVNDDRDPIAVFLLPGWIGGRSLGLYPPQMEFCIQLSLVSRCAAPRHRTATSFSRPYRPRFHDAPTRSSFRLQLLLLQLVLQCSAAVVIYLCIVKQRGTATAYLAGYGAVIPAALYVSRALLELLDIQNKTMRLALANMPTVVVFRTLEAMYGTSDAKAVVESSLPTYAAYYSSSMHYVWDPATGRRRTITRAELGRSILRVLFYFHVTSLVLSLEVNANFQPFASPVRLDHYHFNRDLLSPAHLANAYGLVLLTYLTLATGFELTAFGEHVKGFYTRPIFHNPLFTSRVSTTSGAVCLPLPFSGADQWTVTPPSSFVHSSRRASFGVKSGTS